MNRNNFTIPILVSLFFISCTSDLGCVSSEIGDSKDVNPDAVFFDYRITAEEGRQEVTVRLQFRMGGPNGTTLALSDPSKVELDGEKLPLDSAKFLGAFYEVQKNLDSFSGKHTIIFTDLNGKEYKEEFEFIPFTIEPDVPASLTRGDLVFNFRGLDPVDYIRVTATDTSFTSTDINDIDTVKNGRLTITRQRLSNLQSGPISIEFYKEEEKSLKHTAREGGKLFLTYGLRREFELKAP